MIALLEGEKRDCRGTMRISRRGNRRDERRSATNGCAGWDPYGGCIETRVKEEEKKKKKNLGKGTSETGKRARW